MGPVLLLVVLNVLALSSIKGASINQEATSLASEKDSEDLGHESFDATRLIKKSKGLNLELAVTDKQEVEKKNYRSNDRLEAKLQMIMHDVKRQKRSIAKGRKVRHIKRCLPYMVRSCSRPTKKRQN